MVRMLEAQSGAESAVPENGSKSNRLAPQSRVTAGATLAQISPADAGCSSLAGRSLAGP